MFTIVYNLEDGKVLNIMGGDSNEENMKKALPTTQSFIKVESLPERDFLRQYFTVKDGSLVVENYVLSAEKEKEIQQIEMNTEIQQLKEKLSESDYKTLKYVDGDLTEEEYSTIKAQRQEWRDRINELEEKLNNI